MENNGEEKLVKASMNRFDIWLAALLIKEGKLSFAEIA